MIKITSRPIALVQRGCRVKDIIIQLRLDSEKYYWYYTLQKVFLCLISKLRHADLQLFLHMKVCWHDGTTFAQEAMTKTCFFAFACICNLLMLYCVMLKSAFVLKICNLCFLMTIYCDIQIEILISGHQKHIMLSISKAQAFDLLCKLFFYTLIEDIII